METLSEDSKLLFSIFLINLIILEPFRSPNKEESAKIRPTCKSIYLTISPRVTELQMLVRVPKAPFRLPVLGPCPVVWH